MTTVSPNRETRFRQFLLFVLCSGTGMAAGFDLAEPQIQVNPHRGDIVTNAERYVQRLWLYAPLGTAIGVAAGLVFGYAFRGASWGELNILIILGGLVLGLSMLVQTLCWWLIVGVAGCALGVLLPSARRTS